jgi:hypothetical protein
MQVSAYQAVQGRGVARSRGVVLTAGETEAERIRTTLRSTLSSLHSAAMHRAKATDRDLVLAATYCMANVVKELRYDKVGRYDYAMSLWAGLLKEWRVQIAAVQGEYLRECEQALKAALEKHERTRMEMVAANKEATKVYEYLRDSFTHECVKVALEARRLEWQRAVNASRWGIAPPPVKPFFAKFDATLVEVWRIVVPKPEEVVEWWAGYGRAIAIAMPLDMASMPNATPDEVRVRTRRAPVTYAPRECSDVRKLRTRRIGNRVGDELTPPFRDARPIPLTGS